MGFDPLLMDSNGAGGYHVIVVFSEPVPTADIYALGMSMVSEWERRGLPRQPETYPRHVSHEEGSHGNCLRLFGRHHTREHYTRVWSGDPELSDPWLEGSGAIDRILQTRLAAPPLLPKSAPESEDEKKKSPPTSRKQRAKVCVDLDGVLAEYDGWQGLSFTGSPVPGAVDFTRRLSEIADIIVYTTRCNVEIHRDELKEPTRPSSDLAPRLVHSVRYWLEKHKFTYHDIHAGQGKPLASAYIDDRAIACTPQQNPLAFMAALIRAKELCGRQREQPPAERDDQLQALMDKWDSLSDATKKEIYELAAEAKKPSKAPKTSKPKKK
jgi:hypothetical protein